MTQYATVGTERVVTASIVIPLQGTWVADVSIASGAALPSQVTLTIGSLTMVGHVQHQDSFAGETKARIIGGYGGWRTKLKAKGYNSPIGVKLSSVLGDAARESGEQMATFTDAVVGSHYAREDQAPAERVLRLMAPTWWMGNDGKTNVTARDASVIASPFTVIAWDGGRRRAEIATEAMQDWMPGRKWSSPTVPTAQVISSTTIEVDNDGKLRIVVLSGTVNRALSNIRNIIRDEIAPLTYTGLWEYTVARAGGGTIDCSPVAKGRVPDLTNVPPLGGVTVATPSVLDRVIVCFLNQSPTSPRWMAAGSASALSVVAGAQSGTEHLMTAEATALLVYNVLVALMSAAGGGPLTAVILQPLILAAVNAAITAQSAPAPPGLAAQATLAATLAAGMATGTTPSNTSFPFSISTTTKTPDVSGYFPSIGSQVTT